MNVKNWIEGIGKGSPYPDALSAFDKSIDRSIGGLENKVEKMYNLQRSVPLIEFRDLDTVQTSRVEDFMARVDSAIQSLHNDFAEPPSNRKRDAAASCTFPVPTSTSSAVPTSTGTSVCVGNQVQGSCTAASLPSSTPYSGYLGPVCAKADGLPENAPRLNASLAHAVAQGYCQNLHDSKVVLSRDKPNPTPPTGLQGTAEDGGSTVVLVTYLENSCPEDCSTSTLVRDFI